MKEIKFKLKKGCEFDGDSVSNMKSLQQDIENILDYTLNNSQEPSDYIDVLFNYFKVRPNVVDGVIKEMVQDGNTKPSLETFTNKIALIHLHARSAWEIMNSKKKKLSADIETTIKVPAPNPTGYIIYNSAQEQKKELEKIRNSEDMKDIFPDIARA